MNRNHRIGRARNAFLAVLLVSLGAASTVRAQVQDQPGFPIWPGGTAHSIAIGDLDSDPAPEVLGFAIGGTPFMSALEPDGSFMPGWSYPPPEYPMIGHQELMHIGDITGDGFAEIVFATHLERHFVFAIDRFGALVPGWPVVVGDGSDDIGRIVLADLAGDEALEVIVQDRYSFAYSRIFVYDGAGNVVPGWPQMVPSLAAGLAVGDLEFDGEPEIVVSTVHPLDPEIGPMPIYVFQADGTIRDGWPIEFDDPFGPSNLINVTIADLDGDYRCEIFGTALGAFYVLDWQGQLQDALYDLIVVRPPAVGDLNGDGTLEVVIPWLTLAVYQYGTGVIRNFGSLEEAYDFDAVVILDTDGDGQCEIGARSRFPNHRVHLWDQYLDHLPGFPIAEPDVTPPPRRIMEVTDLDGDQDLELIYSDGLEIDAIDLPNSTGLPPRIEWGHYYHDPQRTGFYHHGRPPGPRFLRGDTNRDGVVGYEDAFVSLNYLRGAITDDCPARHDFDGDGRVILGDVIAQLTYLFLGGVEPAAPFPHCREVQSPLMPCAREACP